MSDTSVWYGIVSSYKSRQITITNGVYTGTYTGSFLYDDFGNVYGTLTGYQFKANGSLQFTVSDFSIDAYRAMIWIKNDNLESLYQTVLSGADTIRGSRYSDTLRGFAGDLPPGRSLGHNESPWV